jgi:CheY-like chemotaxis protein
VARITVVNDNPEFLELIGDILRDERYETTLVDGDRPGTYEEVRRSEPDLLVIDLRMGTDEYEGWSIVRRMREEPRFRRLPIVIVTADVPGLHSLEAELSGAPLVATLTKPFEIDELTRTLEKLLKQEVG